MHVRFEGPIWRGSQTDPLGEKKKPTSLGGSLASNLGEGVLSQAGIEDSIGDLVAIQGVLVRIDAADIMGFPLRGKKKLTQSYRGDPHRRTRR